MHGYEYRYRRKRKKNIFVPGMLIGLAALLAFFCGQPRLTAKLKQEMSGVCYEKMLAFAMPALAYDMEEKEKKTLTDKLLAHFFMAGNEEVVTKEYQTQVESELSHELILAREAADENYVDESGELVLTDEIAEVSVEKVPEAAEQEQPKTAESADSAEAAAAERTPQLTAEGRMPGASEKVVVYPREKLNDFDFLLQNFYQVDNTTTIDGETLNAQKLLKKDMRLTHDASAPQILIYHTHSQECYADSIEGDLATSVVGVGDYLTNILTEQYGLNVIHHKGTYDVGDRDHAYSKAGPALEQILAENPSIEVVIDLHRDGVREGTRLVTNIGGKEMAQIMFFNGLSRTTKTGDIAYLYNPYKTDNLAISLQMQLAAAEYYPGFTRRVYLKGYRYNMHYCPKTLLIEVGAQTNTFGEALNAMEPLADILNKVLTEKSF